MKTTTNKDIAAMVENAINTARPLHLPVIRNSKTPWPPSIEPLAPRLGVNPYALDFCQNIGKRRRKRTLTAAECREMFGESQSIKMNFIPQMVGALMLDQAAALVNYCRDHRVSETKKHTRVVKKAVEEYARRLAEAYGENGLKAYLHYANRYKAETATDVWLMEREAVTLCANQHPEQKHGELAARVLITTMLIRYVENYDREVDEMIYERMGVPCQSKATAHYQLILAMCLSLAEDLGFKVDPSKEMGMWVQVLANKAWRLADTLIEEEKN